MMEYRAWAEVDLDAITHNVRLVRRLARESHVLAVVKADAYGHGAVEVSRAAVEAGVAFLGVGDSGEALQLREAGIHAPILVLGSLIPGEIEPVLTHDVSVTVHSSAKIRLLAQMGRALARRPKVHLKIDTGMGRLGALPSRAMDLLVEIRESDVLELEGLSTHLAATESEDPFTQVQLKQFAEIVASAQSLGFSVPYRHAENSLALFHPPAGRPTAGVLNLVRPGGAIYGILHGSPREEESGLRPALSLKSQVVFLKDLPAGATVGYARAFVAKRNIRIALLPIGYNDGLPFAASNRAEALVRSQRVRLAGLVSMDYAAFDVTDVPEVSVGDEAVLIGSQGAERIGAGDLARAAGTIPYEILCRIGKRVRRIYLRQ